MNAMDSFNSDLQHARQLHAQGDHGGAELHYKQLLEQGLDREAVLCCLVELYMQQGRVNDSVQSLTMLTDIVPDRLYYFGRLASLLDGMGQTEAAISQYQRLLANKPGLADAYFNMALLYKKLLRYQDALHAYQSALDRQIENIQEVYSNIGVLYADMHQYDAALEMYTKALEADPDYIPARFNLAGLYEETGQRDAAKRLYEAILAQDPQHWDSIARLAYLKRVTPEETELVSLLRRSAEQCKDQPLQREGLLFALGKALDDTGDYDQAFEAYESANALGRQRFPPYDEGLVSGFFQQQVDLFTPDLIQSRGLNNPERPVFICGMLRSGSTLVEQILASHSGVHSGGELDYLPRLVNDRLMPYPQKLLETTPSDLEKLARDYLEMKSANFPGTEIITDKRPDNFIFLGLIRILFPQARIIYTQRNPVDNCLSVFFQQLGGNLNYSTQLQDTGHYYLQHRRLMAHWQQCFTNNIFVVDYDQLVNEPESSVRSMLAFLDLPWEDQCLEFSQHENQVRTASLWQVREPLHGRSSGRRENYAQHLEGLRRTLEI